MAYSNSPSSLGFFPAEAIPTRREHDMKTSLTSQASTNFLIGPLSKTQLHKKSPEVKLKIYQQNKQTVLSIKQPSSAHFSFIPFFLF